MNIILNIQRLIKYFASSLHVSRHLVRIWSFDSAPIYVKISMLNEPFTYDNFCIFSVTYFASLLKNNQQADLQ